MNSVWPFRTAFNSHHKNILKKCGISEWHQLIFIYEAQNQIGFFRMVHRLQVVYNGETITLPKKLSDSIHAHIGVYFGKSVAKPKCLINHCGIIFNAIPCA